MLAIREAVLPESVGKTGDDGEAAGSRVVGYWQKLTQGEKEMGQLSEQLKRRMASLEAEEQKFEVYKEKVEEAMKEK